MLPHVWRFLYSMFLHEPGPHSSFMWMQECQVFKRKLSLFFSFLHVFAGQWLVRSKVLCIPSDCESRNNFVLVEERGVAKNWMLPSLLMNPSFKSQMLYIIKPNWADYQENSVIQKNKREKSLCFMKEEVVPERGWNVKNAFSIWIPHIDRPVSSFPPPFI